MAFFDIFGRKGSGKGQARQVPFHISTEFVPYRLYSGKKSNTTLFVRVENPTSEAVLTSLMLELPNKISFDDMMLAREREMRLGELAPKENREVKINLHNNLDADKGEYTIMLTAMAHYRDYSHIMNAMKKRISLQVS